MELKTATGCIIALLGVFITQPIWYYLLYQILMRVEATDLMWFLYWVYVPIGLLIGIIGAIFTTANK
jgi:hypothetical protein